MWFSVDRIFLSTLNETSLRKQNVGKESSQNLAFLLFRVKKLWLKKCVFKYFPNFLIEFKYVI